MNRKLVHVALVVRDYDEAIDFYVDKLGFELVEDSYQPEQDKRWVVVKPKGEGRLPSFWRERQLRISKSSSAISPAGACFFFWAPTISRATIRPSSRQG